MLDTPQPAGGQPRGLLVLAGTEAWERFSYYGMSALLALYLVNELLLPGNVEHVIGFATLRAGLEGIFGPLSTQALASQIFGIYSAFVYLTPILGGLLADRLLGARKTVIIGGVLLAAGHFAMAFSASFLLALLLLILGTGCLKGNISAQVGRLYPDGETEARTRGYMVFSIAISVGAMIGPVVCGALAQAYGWHAGFGAAAALMMIGLLTYVLGLRRLPLDPPRRVRTARQPLDVGERRTIGALALVVGITVFQSTAYNQSANVGLVWIAANVDLGTGLGKVPAAWFPSLDALAGILAAPVLIALWTRREARGRAVAPLRKIATGAAIAAGASWLLAAGAASAGPGGASLIWPVLAFAAFGVGYMHYWPTCLALISEAAPERLKATLMSLSFVSFFFSNLLVGWFGSFYEPLGPIRFWLVNGTIALGGAVLAVLLRRQITAALEPRPSGLHEAGERLSPT